MTDRRRPWLAVLLALALAACSSGSGGTSSSSSEPSTSAAPAQSTTTTVAASTTGTAAASSSPPATSPSQPLGSSVPLFPFATLAEVESWKSVAKPAGHQPWHLDPADTALAFATWLGYPNVNTVISSQIGTGDAHVSIGVPPEGSAAPLQVANVHLKRWGSSADDPWEVVGTEDTTLTLSQPAYGSTVTSPLKVGGMITGVDESIGVQVRDLTSPAPVGSYCCLPAGGTDSPWNVTVPFSSPAGTVLTIVAETGGHREGVERFAVTGVRVGG